MKNLRISKKLSLPPDFVTQSAAILARKRSGKSYTARKIVEQLMKIDEQVIIIDPKGDWHGILSSADGKSAGYPVTIFGGEHQHVPLEVQGGELVARIAVEERVSMLLDLSELRKNEVAKFMTDFLETLYRLKAKDANRTTAMLVVDEADAIAPQNPYPNETRMLGAIEDIVRRAGQRGLGCLLVSQRSAVLNKNVLTQTQVLIAMKTIAPQDLEALEAWIKVHGTKEQKKTLMESLPALPVGEAWFWSPGWPTAEGIFQLVKVDPIETFDSGATPKPGEKRKKPKKVAEIDRERMRKLMAEAVARADANDPKKLHAELAKLKAELKKPAAVSTAPKGLVLGEFEIVVDRRHLEETIAASEEFEAKVVAFEKSLSGLHIAANTTVKAARRARQTGPAALSKRLAKSPAPKTNGTSNSSPNLAPIPRAVLASTSFKNPGGDSALGRGGLRRILIALAQRPDGLTNRQIGLRAGLSSQSGTFSNYLSRARQAGWLTDDGDKRRITQTGLEALGSFESLPEGAALLSYWLGELGRSGASRMLQAVADAYPEALTNEEIGSVAGVSSESGTFANYMSRLRGLELITGGRGETRLSEELAG